MSGPDSLELALIMKKKERKKKEKLTNGLFFEHLVLACTIVLMVLLDAQFAGDSDFDA